MNQESVEMVFVYGTLMSGEGNNRFLRGQRLLDGAAILPNYTLVSAGQTFMGFPVAISSVGSFVQGELWMVDAVAMVKLDKLEGVPNHYQRVKRSVLTGLLSGEPRKHFTWVYTQDVRGGDGRAVLGPSWRSAQAGFEMGKELADETVLQHIRGSR